MLLLENYFLEQKMLRQSDLKGKVWLLRNHRTDALWGHIIALDNCWELEGGESVAATFRRVSVRLQNAVKKKKALGRKKKSQLQHILAFLPASLSASLSLSPPLPETTTCLFVQGRQILLSASVMQTWKSNIGLLLKTIDYLGFHVSLERTAHKP